MPPDSARRERVAPPAEPDHLEGLVGAAHTLGMRDALHLEAVPDVVADTAVGEESEALEHHREVLLPQAPQLARPRLHDVDLAVVGLQPHVARGRRDQPVEAAQQRRLPGAGQPHDDEELAGLEGERHVVHADHVAGLRADLVLRAAARQQVDGGLGAVPEDLGQRFHTDQRRT
jgi:hypothetical protein